MVAKKKTRLLQILGKLNGEADEESEGEDLGEDSTGNKYNLYFTQGQFSKQFFSSFLLFYTGACLYCSTIFPLDESEEEERVKLLTKEEVDVMCSWVEAGGFPAQPEEEAKGLLAEVSSFPCSRYFLPLFPS